MEFVSHGRSSGVMHYRAMYIDVNSSRWSGWISGYVCVGVCGCVLVCVCMCVRVYTAGHYLQNGAGMGFDSMPLLLAPLRQRSVELSYTYEQIQAIHCFLPFVLKRSTK